jgi:isoaspartyl peptidase/L-asparaginase-like protein (Ntn-hydrolase superfamily)
MVAMVSYSQTPGAGYMAKNVNFIAMGQTQFGSYFIKCVLASAVYLRVITLFSKKHVASFPSFMLKAQRDKDEQ